MSIFFSLFSNGWSCLIYGLLISVVLCFIIGVFVISLRKDAFRSLPFIVSIGALFIVAFINMSIMTGAIKIKSTLSNSLEIIEQIQDVVGSTNFSDLSESIMNGDYSDAIKNIGKSSENLDFQKAQELKNQLGDNWELLKLYFKSSDISAISLIISPLKAVERLKSSMNGIIIGNILWVVAFILLSIILGLMVNKNSSTNSIRSRRSTASQLSNRTNNHINRTRYGKSHFSRNRRNRL